MYRFLTNVALDDLNTFRLNSKAASFLQIDHLQQLEDSHSDVQKFNNRFVLGGGSNLLLVGDYDGLVIYPQLKGIELLSENQQQVFLRVSASENWHDFVTYCLDKNYFGLENLALIPGTVGAAPVQNIGAYGVEVESFIRQVHCFDFENGEFVTLSHTDCQFAYRDSFIKRAGQGRYLVTSVDFLLKKNAELVVSYQPLKELFAEKLSKDSKSVTAKDIFDKVCEVRSAKLPDPKQIPNAGSFFKNPLISKRQFLRLKEKFPDIVGYPQKELTSNDSDNMAIKNSDETNENYKIAAGWLIDRAGFKGKIYGKVGVHKHQALVLVNYSDQDGNSILSLANQIIDKIKQLFEIELVPEVRILGNLKALNDGESR